MDYKEITEGLGYNGEALGEGCYHTEKVPGTEKTGRGGQRKGELVDEQKRTRCNHA